MYTVYKHTCPNNKVYIGITCQKVNARWRHGEGYQHNDHFLSAIRKYGWDNFKHEILYTGLTHEEAEAKEIELIAFYQSADRRFGYNNTKGGCHKGMLSEETKRKISQAHMGMKYGEDFSRKISASKMGNKYRLGKTFSDESKRKISEKNKGKSAGEKNYFYGVKFIGKDNPRSKPIARYDINGNYIDSRESAGIYVRELGIRNASHISQVCHGLRKTAYGYVWKYVDSGVEV